jgi:hypothetical protein
MMSCETICCSTPSAATPLRSRIALLVASCTIDWPTRSTPM